MSQASEVLDQLSTIKDPDQGKDIVSLGYVTGLEISKEGHVSFEVALTTPSSPANLRTKEACETAVRLLPWVTRVVVRIVAAEQKGNAPKDGLAEVTNLLAISSCKGGVGKSTVAVNMAFSLARDGAKVGLFDADVYGPSLPTMVHPRQTEIYQNEHNMIMPLVHEGVKLMSFGFLQQQTGGGPAIMRGPMVTQVINQLLTTTAWGELDYLVIDFPPGTGDIQLTLTQLVPLSAAVIVTTPQELSFVDVVKGIQMFDKLKVPTVAVVENMSYFKCTNCNEKHYPFGQGARQRLVGQFGIKNSFDLPMVAEVSRHGDSGTPLVLADPDGELALQYKAIAQATVKELSALKSAGHAKPEVTYNPERGMVITAPSGAEVVLSAPDLRRRCRCAHCVEEMTGERLLKPEDVSEDTHPTLIKPMGNYAVAIQWSDGHNSSIYPYDTLLPEPIRNGA